MTAHILISSFLNFYSVKHLYSFLLWQSAQIAGLVVNGSPLVVSILLIWFRFVDKITFDLFELTLQFEVFEEARVKEMLESRVHKAF